MARTSEVSKNPDHVHEIVVEEARGLNTNQSLQPSRLDRFKARARDWGWKRAAYWYFMHALGRGLGFHIQRVNVEADRVDLIDPIPPVVPSGYVTKLCSNADLQSFKVPNLGQEFIDEVFDRGDECAASFYRGELVAFRFTSRTRTMVTDQLDVLIPKGFRYSYKAWTHPEHRRKNISRMCLYVEQTQSHRPFEERGIFYVETHNYPTWAPGQVSQLDNIMCWG